MKSIMNYFVILLLLVAAITCIVYMGSSNVTSAVTTTDTPIATVTSSSEWTVMPASTEHISQSIPSFFTCVFGVRIFPGTDHIGAYSINSNPNYVPDKASGKVSGRSHMYLGPVDYPIRDIKFYLVNLDNGASGSYFAITDAQGYYEIDHVPFGNYSVFAYDKETMQAGNGEFVNSIHLTVSNPDAVGVDWQVMP